MSFKKIIVSLLVFCMCVGLVPFAAFADTNVAEIGGVGYPSLADAIAAVPTDGTETTIVMLADSAESGVITIAANKNIVLDLNGKTISYGTATSNASVYFITNKGTLEIIDSDENGLITLNNTAANYSYESVTIYNLGGTLTLTSGKIENLGGGLSYAVNNSSNAWGTGDDKYTVFNMNGGTLTAPSGDAALRVYQNCAANSVVSSNTVSITGGTILDTGIFVDSYIYQPTAEYTGENINIDIDISGGTINGLIDMKLRHPFNTSLNITDGDFTNAKMRVRKYTSEYANVLSEPSDPIVTISGGSFAFVNSSSAFSVSSGWDATSSWSTCEKIYEVSGGRFSEPVPAQFCADGMIPATLDEQTLQYTVGTAINYVAQIGDVKYETLADAIAAASEGDTIVLLADDNVSLTNGAELEINKSLTIDGDGHTIYGTSNQTGYNDIFITGSGNVTITDVNIEGFGNNAATDIGHAPIYVSSNFTGEFNLIGVNISNFNRGGVFLYGGTFNVEGCDINCANSRSGAFTKGIEIKNGASGTIVDTCIYNMERSSTTYSSAGIEIYGYGDIVVDNCIIESNVDDHTSVKATFGIVTGTVGAYCPDGGSLQVVDTTINVDNASLSADADEYTISLEDCTFTNYIASWNDTEITIDGGFYSEDVYVDQGTVIIHDGEFTNFAPYASANGSIVIDGGTFDIPVDLEYCADGYIPAEAGEDGYTVAEGYFVTFDIDGTTTDVAVLAGETVDQPEDPTKLGFIFMGWNDENDDLFDFNTPINDAVTLTAQWVEVCQVFMGATADSSKTRADVYFRISEYADANELVITFDGTSYLLADLSPDANGYGYKFSVIVPAKNMGDEIAYSVEYNGETILVGTASIAQYAERLAAMYPDEYSDFVDAMLTYGAAAQLYFEYNTDELVGTVGETVKVNAELFDSNSAKNGMRVDSSIPVVYSYERYVPCRHHLLAGVQTQG